MILLVDNYDSFVYNLYQLIGSINPKIKVIRNDELNIEQIKKFLKSASHLEKPSRFHCKFQLHWVFLTLEIAQYDLDLIFLSVLYLIRHYE